MANHIAFITTNPSIITQWYSNYYKITNLITISNTYSNTNSNTNNDIDDNVNQLKLPGIAIAYRSIPLTNKDYTWIVTNITANNTQLYIDHNMLYNNYNIEHTKQLPIYQKIPNIKLPYSTSSSYNYWQIHMPDKKLLSLDSNLAIQHSTSSTNDLNKLVISWVIDEPKDMFDSLSIGVHGIISNKPIELLSLLTYTYDKICINHTLRIH